MDVKKESKELSLCHKLEISSPYIFVTQFQTMNCVRSDNLSLKNQRCTQTGCKDIGILNFEFDAKTQFLFNGLLKENTISFIPIIY